MLERDQFVVRSANSGDIDRLVAFHGKIFQPSVGVWAEQLLSGTHPTVSASDFSIIEDSISGEIVSSVCIIRQSWLFEGISINVGQLELVGTDERYRRRGLIRAQMEWFTEQLKRHHCVLSSVRGVPTLYQHLGYQFAIPLKGGMRLHLEQIPPCTSGEQVNIRACTQSDLPQVGILNERLAQSLTIHLPRSLELWDYQENQSPTSEHAYETYVLECSGAVGGYMRLPRHNKLDSLVIRELAVSSYPDLLAFLAFAREQALERKQASILLQLPQNHPVMPVLQDWGAQVIAPFAWQVRVVDWVGFFNVIQPLLEARLSRSLHHSFSGELNIVMAEISLTVRLCFEKGKIIKIELKSSSARGQLNLTGPILTMLVMGYRDRAELEQTYLEMQTSLDWRYLIDVLFPKVHAFIYEPY